MKLYHNYYYKMKEVFNGVTSLATAMTDYYGTLPGWYLTSEATYLEELFRRLLNSHNREGIYFSVSHNDYDLTVQDEYDELVNESASRIEDLFETIRETKDKYIEVIKTQATLKSDLLKPIENVSKHYNNDTPETNGTYIDESYTSSYNKDVQEIDLGSVSQKIAEVDVAMEDHYELWLNHFKRFRLLED